MPAALVKSELTLKQTGGILIEAQKGIAAANAVYDNAAVQLRYTGLSHVYL